MARRMEAAVLLLIATGPEMTRARVKANRSQVQELF